MKKPPIPGWSVVTVVTLLLVLNCRPLPVDLFDRIFPTPTLEAAIPPVWYSPDILYHVLVFEDDGEKVTTGIWRMTPDGKGKSQITDFGWYASYSPDYSRIAFSEFYDNGIWVVNSDGSNLTRITDFGSAPSWSPDGSRLVFHAGGQAGADRYLWVANADGTDARQISTVNGSFGDWSPAGDQILFHGEVNSGIWVINPDGSGERLLDSQGGYPAWSPDGEMIAYVDLVDWGIWVMRGDGTDKIKLTDNSGLQPAWSNDGSRVAYDNEGIWIVNADGSDNHQISQAGKHPDW